MALTDIEIKRLTCPDGRKQVKKSDGNGLFIIAKSNGSKLWRYRYKFGGKYQELSLGQYPDVSLKKARDVTALERAKVVQGVNPAAERRANKLKHTNTGERMFSQVALAWWEQQESSWTPEHAKKVKRWISEDVKQLAKLRVDEIDQGHITKVMKSIEKAGTPRKAPPILSVINRVFGYALAHRYTTINPAQNLPLSDILKPMPKVKHRAAITQTGLLAQLIRDIDNNDSGSYCTVEALKLIPRLFLRPKEIRTLKWEYLDFEQALLRIPAEEMKRDREHLVPLATQVINQLESVKQVTGYSEYIFPNERNAKNPLSKNVMTNRLRQLGYPGDVMSAHGFRSTASTILHEQGWKAEVIETQLAHLIGSATSRAYNRSLYLAERRQMMQSWADYLDALRDGAEVVSIGNKKNG